MTRVVCQDNRLRTGEHFASDTIIDRIIRDHLLIWLHKHYYGEDTTIAKTSDVIHFAEHIKGYVLEDGCVLERTPCGIILECQAEYDWSDLRETDTVLDIGGNVGGFSIPAAKKCKQVCFVEPLYSKEIMDNIARNNLHNIKGIIAALGERKSPTDKIRIDFNGKSAEVSLLSFREICGIFDIWGKIDFLKCDCEGGEEWIVPEDLLGIRRIEMEFHYPATNPKIEFLAQFIRENWNTYETTPCPNSYVIHAFQK